MLAALFPESMTASMWEQPMHCSTFPSAFIAPSRKCVATDLQTSSLSSLGLMVLQPVQLPKPVSIDPIPAPNPRKDKLCIGNSLFAAVRQSRLQGTSGFKFVCVPRVDWSQKHRSGPFPSFLTGYLDDLVCPAVS